MEVISFIRGKFVCFLTLNGFLFGLWWFFLDAVHITHTPNKTNHEKEINNIPSIVVFYLCWEFLFFQILFRLFYRLSSLSLFLLLVFLLFFTLLQSFRRDYFVLCQYFSSMPIIFIKMWFEIFYLIQRKVKGFRSHILFENLNIFISNSFWLYFNILYL